MHATPSGLPAVLRGVAEPLLALAAALALAVVLALPLVPKRQQLEVTLRPAPDERPLSHAELVEEVQALGVAADVRVVLAGGASRLVLAGVEEGAAVELRVADVLSRSGYQEDDFVRNEVPHVEALMRADAPVLQVLMATQAVIFLGAGLLLARRRLAGTLPPVTIPWWKTTLLGVGAGVGAVLLSSGISIVLKLVGLPVEEQSWLLDLFTSPENLMLIWPWVVLIAPVSEEVFFRGYVFRHIAKYAGLPAGLALSSVLFAFIHFNPSGLVIYLGIGWIMAWVYLRTGRLVAPILGHVTHNTIVLVASLLTVKP